MKTIISRHSHSHLQSKAADYHRLLFRCFWRIFFFTSKIRRGYFSASMLVRHADNGKKYLYDVLEIKKKRAARLSENTVR